MSNTKKDPAACTTGSNTAIPKQSREMDRKNHSTLSWTERKLLLETALHYAREGFAVFPCMPHGKAPIGWLVPHGHLDATTDPVIIKDWWKAEPDANIGLVPPDSYAVVDIDPRDGGDITFQLLGETAHTLTVYSGGPDGGSHKYYRNAPEGLPGTLGKGIQLKANGHGYVIAPPSIHPSGGTYRWEHSFDPAEIRPWPTGLGAIRRTEELATGRLEKGNGILTPSQVKALLALISSDDYDIWIKVGQVLKTDYEDVKGYDWWVEWSGKSKKHKLGECADKWGTFKREGLTTGTLVQLAGGKIPAPLPEEEFDLLDDTPTIKKIPRLVGVNLGEVKLEPINWLVPDYFAKGMMFCIAGYGGAGKSVVASTLMAALTRGKNWIDGTNIPDGAIEILVVTEEQVKYSLGHRIELAGGDRNKIMVITGAEGKRKNSKEEYEVIPWNLAEHIEQVRLYFKEHPNCKLLFIDPIGSYMEGSRREVDTWKDSDVRNVLKAWMVLAEELNITIIYTAHFNKGKTARAADKVMGSAAFTTTTRETYLVGEPDPDWLEQQSGGTYSRPEDPKSSNRVFVSVKCNIGPRPDVLVVRFDSMGETNANPKGRVLGRLGQGAQRETEIHLMDGGDSGGTKKEGRQNEVLELIRVKPGLTRRAIGKELELSEMNVSKYINELINQGLVYKIQNGNITWVYPEEDESGKLLLE